MKSKCFIAFMHLNFKQIKKDYLKSNQGWFRETFSIQTLGFHIEIPGTEASILLTLQLIPDH